MPNNINNIIPDIIFGTIMISLWLPSILYSEIINKNNSNELKLLYDILYNRKIKSIEGTLIKKTQTPIIFTELHTNMMNLEQ